MKKKIINNTIVFIGIIGFILGFSAVFGDENTLVGVMAVTMILMFMGTDLTGQLFKHSSKLLILNVMFGVATFVAHNNVLIGVPINFISVFLIGMTFYYNQRMQMYLPFLLQYAFMLYTPVELKELPLRLASLLVGPIIIAISQAIIHKKKKNSISNPFLAKSTEKLLQRIVLCTKNEIESKNGVLSNEIQTNIDKFRTKTYDQRKNGYYYAEDETLKLDISFVLERINIYINEDRLNNLTQEQSKIIMDILNATKGIFYDNDDIDNNTEIVTLGIIKLKDTIHNNHIDSDVFCDFCVIGKCFEVWSELKNDIQNKIKPLEKIPEIFSTVFINKEKMITKTIEFAFSFRIALGVTVSALLVEVFQISEGKWIVFTIISLVVPLYEIAKTKALDRMFATIIGSIVVAFLFLIVESTTGRTALLLFAGYVKSYIGQYKYATIFTTISAIGAVSLSGGADVFLVERIVMVFFGAVLANLINKFVFNFTVEKANKGLLEIYDNVIGKMVLALKNLLEDGIVNDKIKSYFILSSLIEKNIKNNSDSIKETFDENLLNKRKKIVNTTYEHYLLVKYDILNEDVKQKISDTLK